MSMHTNPDKLKQIIEGALLAAGRPLSIDQILSLFLDEGQPSREEIRSAIAQLQEECGERGVELKEVSSGFRYQVKVALAPWIARLWEERPSKYSRATLETLALIAYRQPITRSEIEDVRGVTVSSNIIKSLLEREWIRVIGHRDVPGKPALYGTTKGFLDYFNLKSLSDLPPLAELRSIDSIEREFDFGEQAQDDAGDHAANDAGSDTDQVQPVALADADEHPAERDTADVETDAAQAEDQPPETRDEQAQAEAEDDGSDSDARSKTEAAY
jgi:segregation and condensation protein B